MDNNTLLDIECYIPAFVEDLLELIEEKKRKYGDRWKMLPVMETEEFDHQNKRFFRTISQAYEKWERGEGEIDFVAVALEALICWARENDPQ